MPSVRISTNWQHPERTEWLGAPKIDKNGSIERSAPLLPEEVYQGIERSIATGHIEGDYYLKGDQSRFHWFLDR